MFLRPDFLNLTICAVGLYMMFNIDLISKGKFRALVLGILLSLVYDFAWFQLKHSEYAPTGDQNDGSTEMALRKFSLTISYASFIFRVSKTEFIKLSIILIPVVHCGDSFLEGLLRLRKDHPRKIDRGA
jgi:hypothetical protein